MKCNSPNCRRYAVAGKPDLQRNQRSPGTYALPPHVTGCHSKALQANLNVLVADTRVEEAEGTRMRRLSAALLPRVRAQTYANLQNRSLSAFGISFPGLPQVVGPFSNYDFRFYAQQNIVDLQSYRELKASERALDAGKMDYQDARDLIIRAIASLYLNAQSAAARVDAAQSRVTDSDVLYKLAKDKHDAGTATGVDVLRAQVQLANDKQALLVAQNQYKAIAARPRAQSGHETEHAFGTRRAAPLSAL
jgi:outer membrane protein TolC